jgi:hypothetical protein
MMQIKDGWQWGELGTRQELCLFAPGVDTDSLDWTVDLCGDSPGLWVYPKGHPNRHFRDTRKAHEYLMECGVDSPWEVCE